MPKFVGLQNSDYDQRQTDRIFEANCRNGEITTDGIKLGVARTGSLFDGSYKDMIVQSGMFVREKE